MHRKRISRRTFIVGSAAGAAAGGTAIYAGVPALRDRIHEEFDRNSPLGTLNGAERQTILSLVPVLIADRYRPSEERTQNIIDSATNSTPGIFAAYREGARHLDREARQREGTPFSSLPLDRRNSVLESMLWDYPAGPRGNLRNYVTARMEAALISRPTRRLRQLVIRDMIERFYLDAEHELIGYANTPGTPGDPRGYVSIPARKTTGQDLQ